MSSAGLRSGADTPLSPLQREGTIHPLAAAALSEGPHLASSTGSNVAALTAAAAHAQTNTHSNIITAASSSSASLGQSAALAHANVDASSSLASAALVPPPPPQPSAVMALDVDRIDFGTLALNDAPSFRSVTIRNLLPSESLVVGLRTTVAAASFQLSNENAPGYASAAVGPSGEGGSGSDIAVASGAGGVEASQSPSPFSSPPSPPSGADGYGAGGGGYYNALFDMVDPISSVTIPPGGAARVLIVLRPDPAALRLGAASSAANHYPLSNVGGLIKFTAAFAAAGKEGGGDRSDNNNSINTGIGRQQAAGASSAAVGDGGSLLLKPPTAPGTPTAPLSSVDLFPSHAASSASSMPPPALTTALSEENASITIPLMCRVGESVMDVGPTSLGFVLGDRNMASREIAVANMSGAIPLTYVPRLRSRLPPWLRVDLHTYENPEVSCLGRHVTLQPHERRAFILNVITVGAPLGECGVALQFDNLKDARNQIVVTAAVSVSLRHTVELVAIDESKIDVGDLYFGSSAARLVTLTNIYDRRRPVSVRLRQPPPYISRGRAAMYLFDPLRKSHRRMLLRGGAASASSSAVSSRLLGAGFSREGEEEQEDDDDDADDGDSGGSPKCGGGRGGAMMRLGRPEDEVIIIPPGAEVHVLVVYSPIDATDALAALAKGAGRPSGSHKSTPQNAATVALLREQQERDREDQRRSGTTSWDVKFYCDVVAMEVASSSSQSHQQQRGGDLQRQGSNDTSLTNIGGASSAQPKHPNNGDGSAFAAVPTHSFPLWIRARLHQSVLSVPSRSVSFGDVCVSQTKTATFVVENLSALPGRIAVTLHSKILCVESDTPGVVGTTSSSSSSASPAPTSSSALLLPSGPTLPRAAPSATTTTIIAIPPLAKTHVRLRLAPQRVNPEYRKQLIVTNLLCPSSTTTASSTSSSAGMRHGGAEGSSGGRGVGSSGAGGEGGASSSFFISVEANNMAPEETKVHDSLYTIEKLSTVTYPRVLTCVPYIVPFLIRSRVESEPVFLTLRSTSAEIAILGVKRQRGGGAVNSSSVAAQPSALASMGDAHPSSPTAVRRRSSGNRKKAIAARRRVAGGDGLNDAQDNEEEEEEEEEEEGEDDEEEDEEDGGVMEEEEEEEVIEEILDLTVRSTDRTAEGNERGGSPPANSPPHLNHSHPPRPSGAEFEGGAVTSPLSSEFLLTATTRLGVAGGGGEPVSAVAVSPAAMVHPPPITAPPSPPSPSPSLAVAGTQLPYNAESAFADAPPSRQRSRLKRGGGGGGGDREKVSALGAPHFPPTADTDDDVRTFEINAKLIRALCETTAGNSTNANSGQEGGSAGRTSSSTGAGGKGGSAAAGDADDTAGGRASRNTNANSGPDAHTGGSASTANGNLNAAHGADEEEDALTLPRGVTLSSMAPLRAAASAFITRRTEPITNLTLAPLQSRVLYVVFARSAPCPSWSSKEDCISIALRGPTAAMASATTAGSGGSGAAVADGGGALISPPLPLSAGGASPQPPTPPPRIIRLSYRLCETRFDVSQKSRSFGDVDLGDRKTMRISLRNPCEAPLWFSVEKSTSVGNLRIDGTALKGGGAYYDWVKGSSVRDLEIQIGFGLRGTFRETLTITNLLDPSNAMQLLLKAEVRRVDQYEVNPEVVALEATLPPLPPPLPLTQTPTAAVASASGEEGTVVLAKGVTAITDASESIGATVATATTVTATLEAPPQQEEKAVAPYPSAVRAACKVTVTNTSKMRRDIRVRLDRPADQLLNFFDEAGALRAIAAAVAIAAAASSGGGGVGGDSSALGSADAEAVLALHLASIGLGGGGASTLQQQQQRHRSGSAAHLFVTSPSTPGNGAVPSFLLSSPTTEGNGVLSGSFASGVTPPAVSVSMGTSLPPFASSSAAATASASLQQQLRAGTNAFYLNVSRVEAHLEVDESGQRGTATKSIEERIEALQQKLKIAQRKGKLEKIGIVTRNIEKLKAALTGASVPSDDLAGGDDLVSEDEQSSDQRGGGGTNANANTAQIIGPREVAAQLRDGVLLPSLAPLEQASMLIVVTCRLRSPAEQLALLAALRLSVTVPLRIPTQQQKQQGPEAAADADGEDPSVGVDMDGPPIISVTRSASLIFCEVRDAEAPKTVPISITLNGLAVPAARPSAAIDQHSSPSAVVDADADGRDSTGAASPLPNMGGGADGSEAYASSGGVITRQSSAHSIGAPAAVAASSLSMGGGGGGESAASSAAADKTVSGSSQHHSGGVGMRKSSSVTSFAADGTPLRGGGAATPSRADISADASPTPSGHGKHAPSSAAQPALPPLHPPTHPQLPPPPRYPPLLQIAPESYPCLAPPPLYATSSSSSYVPTIVLHNTVVNEPIVQKLFLTALNSDATCAFVGPAKRCGGNSAHIVNAKIRCTPASVRVGVGYVMVPHHHHGGENREGDGDGVEAGGGTTIVPVTEYYPEDCGADCPSGAPTPLLLEITPKTVGPQRYFLQLRNASNARDVLTIAVEMNPLPSTALVVTMADGSDYSEGDAVDFGTVATPVLPSALGAPPSAAGTASSISAASSVQSGGASSATVTGVVTKTFTVRNTSAAPLAVTVYASAPSQLQLSLDSSFTRRLVGHVMRLEGRAAIRVFARYVPSHGASLGGLISGGSNSSFFSSSTRTVLSGIVVEAMEVGELLTSSSQTAAAAPSSLLASSSEGGADPSLTSSALVGASSSTQQSLQQQQQNPHFLPRVSATVVQSVVLRARVVVGRCTIRVDESRQRIELGTVRSSHLTAAAASSSSGGKGASGGGGGVLTSFYVYNSSDSLPVTFRIELSSGASSSSAATFAFLGGAVPTSGSSSSSQPTCLSLEPAGTTLTQVIPGGPNGLSSKKITVLVRPRASGPIREFVTLHNLTAAQPPIRIPITGFRDDGTLSADTEVVTMPIAPIHFSSSDAAITMTRSVVATFVLTNNTVRELALVCRVGLPLHITSSAAPSALGAAADGLARTNSSDGIQPAATAAGGGTTTRRRGLSAFAPADGGATGTSSGDLTAGADAVTVVNDAPAHIMSSGGSVRLEPKERRIIRCELFASPQFTAEEAAALQRHRVVTRSAVIEVELAAFVGNAPSSPASARVVSAVRVVASFALSEGVVETPRIDIGRFGAAAASSSAVVAPSGTPTSSSAASIPDSKTRVSFRIRNLSEVLPLSLSAVHSRLIRISDRSLTVPPGGTADVEGTINVAQCAQGPFSETIYFTNDTNPENDLSATVVGRHYSSLWRVSHNNRDLKTSASSAAFPHHPSLEAASGGLLLGGGGAASSAAGGGSAGGASAAAAVSEFIVMPTIAIDAAAPQQDPLLSESRVGFGSWEPDTAASVAAVAHPSVEGLLLPLLLNADATPLRDGKLLFGADVSVAHSLRLRCAAPPQCSADWISAVAVAAFGKRVKFNATPTDIETEISDLLNRLKRQPSRLLLIASIHITDPIGVAEDVPVYVSVAPLQTFAVEGAATNSSDSDGAGGGLAGTSSAAATTGGPLRDGLGAGGDGGGGTNPAVGGVGGGSNSSGSLAVSTISLSLTSLSDRHAVFSAHIGLSNTTRAMGTRGASHVCRLAVTPIVSARAAPFAAISCDNARPAPLSAGGSAVAVVTISVLRGTERELSSCVAVAIVDEAAPSSLHIVRLSVPADAAGDDDGVGVVGKGNLSDTGDDESVAGSDDPHHHSSGYGGRDRSRHRHHHHSGGGGLFAFIENGGGGDGAASSGLTPRRGGSGAPKAALASLRIEGCQPVPGEDEFTLALHASAPRAPYSTASSSAAAAGAGGGAGGGGKGSSAPQTAPIEFRVRNRLHSSRLDFSVSILSTYPQPWLTLGPKQSDGAVSSLGPSEAGTVTLLASTAEVGSFEAQLIVSNLSESAEIYFLRVVFEVYAAASSGGGSGAGGAQLFAVMCPSRGGGQMQSTGPNGVVPLNLRTFVAPFLIESKYFEIHSMSPNPLEFQIIAPQTCRIRPSHLNGAVSPRLTLGDRTATSISHLGVEPRGKAVVNLVLSVDTPIAEVAPGARVEVELDVIVRCKVLRNSQTTVRVAFRITPQSFEVPIARLAFDRFSSPETFVRLVNKLGRSSDYCVVSDSRLFSGALSALSGGGEGDTDSVGSSVSSGGAPAFSFHVAGMGVASVSFFLSQQAAEVRLAPEQMAQLMQSQSLLPTVQQLLLLSGGGGGGGGGGAVAAGPPQMPIGLPAGVGLRSIPPDMLFGLGAAAVNAVSAAVLTAASASTMSQASAVSPSSVPTSSPSASPAAGNGGGGGIGLLPTSVTVSIEERAFIYLRADPRERHMLRLIYDLTLDLRGESDGVGLGARAALPSPASNREGGVAAANAAAYAAAAAAAAASSTPAVSSASSAAAVAAVPIAAMPAALSAFLAQRQRLSPLQQQQQQTARLGVVGARVLFSPEGLMRRAREFIRGLVRAFAVDERLLVDAVERLVDDDTWALVRVAKDGNVNNSNINSNSNKGNGAAAIAPAAAVEVAAAASAASPTANTTEVAGQQAPDNSQPKLQKQQGQQEEPSNAPEQPQTAELPSAPSVSASHPPPPPPPTFSFAREEQLMFALCHLVDDLLYLLHHKELKAAVAAASAQPPAAVMALAVAMGSGGGASTSAGGVNAGATLGTGSGNTSTAAAIAGATAAGTSGVAAPNSGSNSANTTTPSNSGGSTNRSSSGGGVGANGGIAALLRTCLTVAQMLNACVAESKVMRAFVERRLWDCPKMPAPILKHFAICSEKLREAIVHCERNLHFGGSTAAGGGSAVSGGGGGSSQYQSQSVVQFRTAAASTTAATHSMVGLSPPLSQTFSQQQQQQQQQQMGTSSLPPLFVPTAASDGQRQQQQQLAVPATPLLSPPAAEGLTPPTDCFER